MKKYVRCVDAKNTEVLTLGKEYPVLRVRDDHIVTINDRGIEDFFGKFRFVEVEDPSCADCDHSEIGFCDLKRSGVECEDKSGWKPKAPREEKNCVQCMGLDGECIECYAKSRPKESCTNNTTEKENRTWTNCANSESCRCVSISNCPCSLWQPKESCTNNTTEKESINVDTEFQVGDIVSRKKSGTIRACNSEGHVMVEPDGYNQQLEFWETENLVLIERPKRTQKVTYYFASHKDGTETRAAHVPMHRNRNEVKGRACDYTDFQIHTIEVEERI